MTQPTSKPLPESEMILRRLLWLRHGCDGLYGDDGEMQCGRCMIDFKRDPAEQIDQRFYQLGVANLKEARRGK